MNMFRAVSSVLLFSLPCLFWTTIVVVLPTNTAWTATALSAPTFPKVSPATGLANLIFDWKESQQIRYQVSGPTDGKPVLLVHGLFVNSDHWRKTLAYLSEEGYRVYALDLWGCGYSSKPPRDSQVGRKINGEIRRFGTSSKTTLPDQELGTASGGTKKRIVDVELCHPLESPYNFFTWADVLTDFCDTIVSSSSSSKVTLVSNSIGTISSLQAVLDEPDLFDGVFVVAPNFRELHSAEVAFPQLSMPIVRSIQKLLRSKGQGLFDALAKPSTVKEILKEPYAVESAVDDTLVQVLLDPLLTDGASQVVFDTLSYSAGPLPEIQLANMPADKPVWVCYGDKDPWTPGPRVDALLDKPTVEKVVSLPGIGHCPHDEAPELVHPLLMDFLNRLGNDQEKDDQKKEDEGTKAAPFFCDAV